MHCDKTPLYNSASILRVFIIIRVKAGSPYLYFKNVIDVLRGDAEIDTDGREGLKSLEVLIAAYRSARDGRTVSLPLEY